MLVLLAKPSAIEARSRSEWPFGGLSSGTPDPSRLACLGIRRKGGAQHAIKHTKLHPFPAVPSSTLVLQCQGTSSGFSCINSARGELLKMTSTSSWSGFCHASPCTHDQRPGLPSLPVCLFSYRCDWMVSCLFI